MNSTEFVLDVLRRYGAATINQLHMMAFFSGRSRKLVEKVVARLIANGLVTSHTWRGNEHIYYLTVRGARCLGVPDAKYSKPPGAQAVVESQAMLLFCELRQPAQPRLTAEEFAAQFPELDTPGVCRTRNYLDVTDPGQVRLGVLVPDYGRAVKHVARKVRRERAKRVGVWNEDFEKGRAQFTVLTTTKRKADRIANALRAELYRIIIVVVPELADLVLQRGTK